MDFNSIIEQELMDLYSKETKEDRLVVLNDYLKKIWEEAQKQITDIVAPMIDPTSGEDNS